MDIRGIWKVKEVRFPTPSGQQVFTPDNPPEGDMHDDFVQMTQMVTEFAEDGVLNTMLFVPEEMKEEAEKHGAVVREDGYTVIEQSVWKEENGKFYYDTKVQGEVLGEKVDSFAEIPVTEDGCLMYSFGMLLLERA